jgi:pyridoxal phosphate enzyme (YggS family)
VKVGGPLDGRRAPASTIDPEIVAGRVSAVRQRIDEIGGGRPVRLVAVTKGFGADCVDAAVAAGITLIAENYAQELLDKAAAAAGGMSVRWHFIGAIQRNKVAPLAPFVAVWETVDRPAVAEAIARHSPGGTALVQVNLTGDPGRSGCSWEDAPAVVDAARTAGLEVRGLMGVGPIGPPEASRQPFAQLAALADRLGLADVSMGMSNDFEVAVAEGSTMVRLGTALFGPRPRSDDLRR